MKYDILDGYKEYLQKILTPNTARKYYSSVKHLFADAEIQFDSLSDIDPDYLKQRLKTVKTKNDFSAAKNGLKRLKEYDDSLHLPGEEFFEEISRHKRNRRKNKGKTIYLDETRRKINQISNDRLKLAYRLALISGLRVSELATLEPQDLSFNPDKTIDINVRHGKGGSNGIVHSMPDAYTWDKLQDHVKNYDKGEQLFFSAAYMEEKAYDLGLQCHDLRRIYAITHKNNLKREMPVYEANKIVQGNLRHARYKTTKKYLYTKKLVIKRGEANGE